MNVYHITYSPAPGIACLYFWGCNLKCRACLLKKEIYDCHLPETKEALFDQAKLSTSVPEHFLSLKEIEKVLGKLRLKQAIFMGAEPTIDLELDELAKLLHKKFSATNILLTNGLVLPSLEHIDVIVFSLKAYTESIHLSYTGKSNKQILENFKTIYKTIPKLHVESVLIPGYIDLDEIENIAQFIASIDKKLPYRIDPYLPVGKNPWRRPTENEIREAVKTAKKYLENVTCITGSEELAYEVVRIF